jgi:helicase
MALHALFADNLPQREAKILVDEKATVSAIREALAAELRNASADEVVVISFSGHGAHDHRFTAHDTDVSELAQTTIPMSELAELFRSRRAKAVLCVLELLPQWRCSRQGTRRQSHNA